MCGILGIFDAHSASQEELRRIALANGKLLRPRGPDWSGIFVFYSEHGEEAEEVVGVDVEAPKTESSMTVPKALQSKSAALAHERLAIIDPESGAQPLYNEDETIVLAANGEIYNHHAIRKEFGGYNFWTNSDCEVILPLYEKYGRDMVAKLDGMFAFVIWDGRTRTYFAARDHMGICPLYIGWRADGGVVIASELKALQDICSRFQIFPPGHYFWSGAPDGAPKVHSEVIMAGQEFVYKGFHRWYNPVWLEPSYKPSETLVFAELRARFEKAVVKRMMSDVPWGVLLSGGLDSSLVASCASRHAMRTNSDYPRIHSFSVGLEGSPDLAAARIVAEQLGTKHHEFTFTVQEGKDAIFDVIYALETYDTTTVRAATPMYLMARKIKAGGVKMVLSGEGADEALAGYLYFHKAPSKEALHEETVRKLFALHYYDCLRANKAMSAFGVFLLLPPPPALSSVVGLAWFQFAHASPRT